MGRNILLVEPGYKTKFPPMGLMKISSYHKELGDNVNFIKGTNDDMAYEYWDRIYISTVFTYNWDATVKTINYYKRLVKGDLSRIVVGGIMASLMPKELWQETGITPIIGLLNKPGMLDEGNKRIIDKMIPDYDLFKDSPHKYSLIDDSYFGYSTRGCPNKCKFCGVKTLEPNFVDYKGIKSYVNKIKKFYGEKAHLVLFDNNVLASKKFDKIITDICDLGFEKGSTINYLGKVGQTVHKQRHVDFNQGIDARLLNESKMKLLSKLAIHPLRIAFDHIKDKNIYCDRVRLASKNGINNLSNYILYNFKDTPEDLWNRLKINIDLNKKYSLNIYSFPMKFIPLNYKNRSYISENWNWQFLRGVQRILNVVKGAVMPGEDFFYRAFGHNETEFKEILFMPENILMWRSETPKEKEISWTNKFRKLTPNEKDELLNILCNNQKINDLKAHIPKTQNAKIKRILEYYIPHRINDDKQLRLFDN